jgi:hypothetical protein
MVGGRNVGDAYFDASEASNSRDMDLLVLENFLLEKPAQPKVEHDESWKKEFVLD